MEIETPVRKRDNILQFTVHYVFQFFLAHSFLIPLHKREQKKNLCWNF